MESFVNDNFNKYLPTNKVEDLILKTMPVPIYEAFNVRTIYPIIHSILEKQGKYLNKTFDKTLISVQNKIFVLFMETFRGHPNGQ